MSGNNERVVISVDLMGGDNAPLASLEAISQVIAEHRDVDFVAFGLTDKVLPLVAKLKIPSSRFVFHHSESVIIEDDKPSAALRKHKNTSMSDAVTAVADNKADAVVSAGNTGALMAISVYLLKLLKTIDRPAMLALVPRLGGRACLLDVGANAVCQSRNLQDFAILGSKFAQVFLKKANPTVGLLNIGKESTKGTDIVKSSHEALQDLKLNYIGFVEANELLTGDVDVIVADGFSGNVALKAMEGAGNFCLKSLKNAVSGSFISKLGLALFKIFSSKSMASLDPNEYNGGIFLGLSGIVVKSHGAANVKAFKTCINHAITMVKGDLIKKLQHEEELVDG